MKDLKLPVFAAYLDYSTLTRMAKEFISGENPEANNDPNLMPTRFMILYGADDSKLQTIDQHPDCADGESHPINVENLRKGLRYLGYDVAESGPYDDEVAKAHAEYMVSLMGGTPSIAFAATEDDSETQNNESSDFSTSSDSDKPLQSNTEKSEGNSS